MGSREKESRVVEVPAREEVKSEDAGKGDIIPSSMKIEIESPGTDDTLNFSSNFATPSGGQFLTNIDSSPARCRIDRYFTDLSSIKKPGLVQSANRVMDESNFLHDLFPRGFSQENEKTIAKKAVREVDNLHEKANFSKKKVDFAGYLKDLATSLGTENQLASVGIVCKDNVKMDAELPQSPEDPLNNTLSLISPPLTPSPPDNAKSEQINEARKDVKDFTLTVYSQSSSNAAPTVPSQKLENNIKQLSAKNHESEPVRVQIPNNKIVEENQQAVSSRTSSPSSSSRQPPPQPIATSSPQAVNPQPVSSTGEYSSVFAANSMSLPLPQPHHPHPVQCNSTPVPVSGQLAGNTTSHSCPLGRVRGGLGASEKGVENEDSRTMGAVGRGIEDELRPGQKFENWKKNKQGSGTEPTRKIVGKRDRNSRTEVKPKETLKGKEGGFSTTSTRASATSAHVEVLSQKVQDFIDKIEINEVITEESACKKIVCKIKSKWFDEEDLTPDKKKAKKGNTSSAPSKSISIREKLNLITRSTLRAVESKALNKS